MVSIRQLKQYLIVLLLISGQWLLIAHDVEAVEHQHGSECQFCLQSFAVMASPDVHLPLLSLAAQEQPCLAQSTFISCFSLRLQPIRGSPIYL